MLVELTLPDSEPYDLLVGALRTVTQLIHNQGLITPLTYQSTTLAALALLELTEYETTRDEAETSLKSLVESRTAPSTWDAAVRELIANRKQPASSTAPAVNSATAESKHASVASQSLQRLADLATATEEGRDVTVGEERKEGERTGSGAAGAHFQRFHKLREVVRSGYLSVFAGDAGR
jgi:predicted nucleotidyltransferase